MRLILALSVIASTASADPPKPPAHYAKLFEKDRVLVYDLVHTYPDYEKAQRQNLDDKPVTRWPRITERSVIKCKVTRVVTFSASIASQVECDVEAMPMVPYVGGVFLANAAGLYRIGEIPANEADLPKGDDLGSLEIPATPKVARTAVPQPNNDGKGVSGVRQSGGSWCSYGELTGASHGHNGSSYTCFGRGAISEIYVLDDSYKLRDWKIRAR